MHVSVLFSQVSCLLDSGSVLANPNQNSKYCGEKLKPMLLNYSNCDSLTVNFFSNSSVSKGGFQLRYTITSPGKWPDSLLKTRKLVVSSNIRQSAPKWLHSHSFRSFVMRFFLTFSIYAVTGRKYCRKVGPRRCIWSSALPIHQQFRIFFD